MFLHVSVILFTGRGSNEFEYAPQVTWSRSPQGVSVQGGLGFVNLLALSTVDKITQNYWAKLWRYHAACSPILCRGHHLPPSTRMLLESNVFGHLCGGSPGGGSLWPSMMLINHGLPHQRSHEQRPGPPGLLTIQDTPSSPVQIKGGPHCCREDSPLGQRPPYGNERAVRILLECILVHHFFSMLGFFFFVFLIKYFTIVGWPELDTFGVPSNKKVYWKSGSLRYEMSSQSKSQMSRCFNTWHSHHSTVKIHTFAQFQ